MDKSICYDNTVKQWPQRFVFASQQTVTIISLAVVKPVGLCWIFSACK